MPFLHQCVRHSVVVGKCSELDWLKYVLYRFWMNIPISRKMHVRAWEKICVHIPPLPPHTDSRRSQRYLKAPWRRSQFCFSFSDRWRSQHTSFVFPFEDLHSAFFNILTYWNSRSNSESLAISFLGLLCACKDFNAPSTYCLRDLKVTVRRNFEDSFLARFNRSTL